MATQADYDAMTDDELHGMGMYRCSCGAAVYPNGDHTWHDHSGETTQ